MRHCFGDKNKSYITKSLQKRINYIVIGYVALKIVYYYLFAGGDYWIYRVFSGIITLLVIVPLNSTRLTKRTASVLIPFILTLIESILLYAFVDGDRLYYTFLIGSVALSYWFIDTLGLVLYIILANAVTVFFIFIQGFSMMGYNYSAYDNFLQFFGFNFLSLIFLSICVSSDGKYKKFEEASLTYDGILENTPGFMVVTNEDNEVRHISKSLLNWLGLHNEQDAVGKPFINLLRSDEMKEVFNRIIESDDYVEKTFSVNLDGTKMWFILRMSPLGDNTVAHFIEWVDITEFVKAKDEAEAATRAKSDFLARMSHEIRTPMNAVMGMSELILRENLPKTIYDNALAINNAGANLLSIINDILDLSKIESGKMEITETEYELASLINDVISIIRVRLESKGLLFTVNIKPRLPAQLIGDVVRIRQVMINLLNNAVKYTDEGFISMTVGGKQNENGIVLDINFTDSGIGIKEDNLSTIFNDFFQSDFSGKKNIESSGLGLPITRSFCRLMGGDITVKSVYGQGSTFNVVLPQRYKSAEPFAKVIGADEAFILLFKLCDIYADSLANSLNSLGVPFERYENESSIDYERFTHIFLTTLNYEEIKPELNKLQKPPEAVLLTEYMETCPEDAISLIMPAHSLTIANALNGVFDVSGESRVSYISFISPDARALVVDDIEANLRVAEGLLAPYEIQVDLCESGEEAVKMVSKNCYDIIFMDQMMDGMDGLEATAQIRKNEGEYFKNVPIIALSANAVIGVREMFINAGMNDFIAKPIEIAKLDVMLKKWIPKDKRQIVKKIRSFGSESEYVSMLRALPELSVDEALNKVGHSSVYEKIVKLTVKLLPENMEKLNMFLKMDFRLYSIEVHGIKGVLKNIGAYELAELAYQLEMLSKDGDLDKCIALNPIFNEKVFKFLKTINAAEYDSKEKEAGNITELALALPAVLKAAEIFDGALAQKLLTPFCGYSYGEELDSMIDGAVNALERFDYDGTVDLIEKLIGVMEE